MDWDRSTTLGPALIGVGILVLQYWHQRRDFLRYGHDPRWRVLIEQQLRLTLRFERFFWCGTAVTLALDVRDIIFHIAVRNDMAITLIGVIFCLVLWRKRRFFQACLQQYEPLDQ